MTFRRLYFLALFALAALALAPPYFIEAFELKIYDLLIRYSAPGEPDDRIAIVGIDQRSLDKFGRWPWPRDTIGSMITGLDRLGAKVVALDISFSTEADKNLKTALDEVEGRLLPVFSAEENEKERVASERSLKTRMARLKRELDRDRKLADAIEKAGSVVTAFIFHSASERSLTPELAARKRELIAPFRIKSVSRDQASARSSIFFRVGEPEPNIEIIQKSSMSSGFLNTWTDPDGVIRSIPVVIESDERFYPSLALSASALYSGSLDDLVAFFSDGVFSGVSVGDGLVQTNPYGRIYLRYLGGDETFPIISAADVIDPDLDDRRLRDKIAGKIIFVGATATQIYDLRVTPLGITAGVETHANAASNILNGATITRLEWQRALDFALVLLVGLALYFYLGRVNVALGATTVILALIGQGALTYYLFASERLWVNSVMLALTLIILFAIVALARYLEELNSRRFITDAFERYLSPKLISQIIENPKLLKLGGSRKEITAFFSDIAGFTTISEKMSPSKLSTLLNEYLSEMSEIIQSEDGTVDKFIGDAVVAMWGAPVEQDDHPIRAVRSAVKQQRRLDTLRAQWRAKGYEEIFIRIGINTGVASVGNMGSKKRFDYTMLGDVVNLASRLEGVNKYYGSSILISETVYERARSSFLCREVDRVRVEGKRDAIRLYEVIEETSAAVESDRRFARTWKYAMTLFHQLNFTRAAELFEVCSKLRPGGDGICEVYLKRCSELIKAPPMRDWDRVYDMAK